MRIPAAIILNLLLAASLGTSHCADNLLVNGSMEYWHETGLVPQGWGLWRTPADFHKFRAFRDAEVKRDGKSSLRIETEDFVNVYSGYPVEAGKRYTLSAWIRARDNAEVLVKFSLGRKPEYKASVPETPDALQVRSDLPAGQWTRVHVTGTIPEGADRATLYFCFPEKPNTYHFDMAMLNEGELQPYRVGPNYIPLAPLGSLPGTDEAALKPASFAEDGSDLEDAQVRFLFDRDPMSYGKLSKPDRNLPKRLGATFSRPIHFRGIYILLDEGGIPENIEASVAILQDDAWKPIDAKVLDVGATTLFQTGLIRAEGARINLLPKDGMNIPTPKIYMIGIAQ